MTIVPSLRISSLLWPVVQGAGSSTMIDGKFCLLYLDGLSLGLGRFSSSTSVVCLEDMQQRLDRNPITKPVFCVRRWGGARRERGWPRGRRVWMRGWAGKLRPEHRPKYRSLVRQ